MAAKRGLLDLPPEVFYYHIFPELNRFQILALRHTCTFFLNLTNDDSCWKKFIHYPRKYFLCDLKSSSLAEGINELHRDILQNESNSYYWLDLLRLQEAHLHNWANGREAPYDTIEMPLNSMSYMEELVNEHYDHERHENTFEHLLCFSVGRNIDIWNITSRPQRLAIVNIGSHTLVHLLPGRELLVKGGIVMEVYELLDQVNNGNQLTGQLKFSFIFDEEVPIIGNNHTEDSQRFLNFRFIVMNHIFIGYLCQLPVTQDSVLHIWNLRESRKLFTTSLAGNVQVFNNFIQQTTGNDISLLNLNLFKGEFPSIIVVLKYIFSNSRFSQISVFNVCTGQLEIIVAQTNSEVVSCSMFHSKILVAEKCPYRVTIYSMQQSSLPAVGDDQPISVQGQCLYEFYYGNPQYSVVLKTSKILIRTDSEVLIVSADPIQLLTVPIDQRFKILGFIEPKLLLLYDTLKNPTTTRIVVYNIIAGRLIRSWESANTERSRFNHYFTNLVYPSKLILNIGKTNEFRVHYF